MDVKIKTHLRSKTEKDVNEYINTLENYIIDLKASNTLNLIFKLDEINGIIVEDLDKVINGEASEWRVIDGETVEISNLKVLNDSKDSKVYDRVMTLYGKLKDLQAVSDLVKKMIPEIEEQESVKDKIKYDKSKPVFEGISNSIINGGKR